MQNYPVDLISFVAGHIAAEVSYGHFVSVPSDHSSGMGVLQSKTNKIAPGSVETGARPGVLA